MKEAALANIRFDAAYEKAIEAKQIEEQKAEQKRYELIQAQRQAEIAAAQAKGQGDAAREQADGAPRGRDERVLASVAHHHERPDEEEGKDEYDERRARVPEGKSEHGEEVGELSYEKLAFELLAARPIEVPGQVVEGEEQEPRSGGQGEGGAGTRGGQEQKGGAIGGGKPSGRPESGRGSASIRLAEA